MENKRFCDLVAGDKIYYYEDRIEECKTLNIKEIRKIKKTLLIFCHYGKFSTIKFLINNIEDDFCILDLNCARIWEAIATSMDKLLLECGDINE